MVARERPEPEQQEKGDGEDRSEIQQQTIILPPDKDGGGVIRRWWSYPLVRQILGTLVGLVVIAGVIGILVLRLQRSPPQSGSEASAAGEPAVFKAEESPSERFARLRDSVTAAIERYENRRQQFDPDGTQDTARSPVDCNDLVSSYEVVDERFVALAAEYRTHEALLDVEQRERFRELFDQVSEVNQDFDQSGCIRP